MKPECGTSANSIRLYPRPTLVRFAFCKRDETLDEAIRRLGSLAGA